jgi:hypothetical protein
MTPALPLYWIEAIMSDRKIAIPGVYDRVEKVANAEGATVEELVTKALERELARRCWSKSSAKGRLAAGT